MGGGGGKGGRTSGSRALEGIAQQLFTETTPLRGDILGALSDILTGGGGFTAPTPTPAAAPAPAAGTALSPIAGIFERLFPPGGVARRAALAGTTTAAPTAPTAGGVGPRVPIVARATEQALQAGSQARTELEEFLGRTGLAGTPFGARAVGEQALASRQAVTGVPTRLFEAFFPIAANFALGQGTTAVSGLGGAAAAQAGLGGSQARSEGAILSSLLQLGAGAGGGAAAKGAKGAGTGLGAITSGLTVAAPAAAVCWIADALYGKDSVRARLARWWVSEGWRGPVAATVRWAYRRCGRRVAGRIKRGGIVGLWLRRMLQPHFDRAVEHGKRAMLNQWSATQPPWQKNGSGSAGSLTSAGAAGGR